MPTTNIVLAVWDEQFVDKFVTYSMGALLHPNNVPALAARREVRFKLFTDRASEAYFRERAAALLKFVDLDVFTFEDTVVDGRTIAEAIAPLEGPTIKHEVEMLAQFHTIDIAMAQGGHSSIFPISADSLLFEGSFGYAQDLLDGGAEVVVTPFLRLAMDAFIRGEQEHLHPVTRSWIANSDRFTNYPSTIMWPVRDLGYVCHTFFPIPIAFKPTPRCTRFERTIDYDFAVQMASEASVIAAPRNSQEFLLCKLTTEDYLADEAPENKLTVTQITHFLLTETNQAHRTLVSRPYRIYGPEGTKGAEELWAAVSDVSILGTH
ncbi:MAG: hypothetical protein QF654_01205 [Alphaproteobacteria bacterium]|nr:hypothetical protein [Alphaproteobacteria bacterium]